MEGKVSYTFSSKQIGGVRRSLLQWYGQNKRDLPWREAALHGDRQQHAYAVWVSEIMLQQTRVATVIDYYKRWMERWPTVKELAGASLEQVNEVWSGLGYYSRAKRLHLGAIKVMTELGGKIPENSAELRKEIPGVGRYTAAAIASIAFGEEVGVLDGNVIRVLCRMLTIGGDSTSKPVLDHLWQQIDTLVPSKLPGDFNQAMMELGAMICTPKSPLCDQCPLRVSCQALRQVESHKENNSIASFQEGRTSRTNKRKSSDNSLEFGKKLKMNDGMQEEVDIESCADSLSLPSDDPWRSSLGVMNYPRKPQKKAARSEVSLISVVECVAESKVKVENENQQSVAKFLITQRPETGLLAGLWEFPAKLLNESEISAPKFKKMISEKKKKATGTYIAKMMQETLAGHLSGYSVASREYVGELTHVFSHIHLKYIIEHVAVKRIKNEHAIETLSPKLEQNTKCKWVSKDELKDCAMSSAMYKILKLSDVRVGSQDKKQSKVRKTEKTQTKLESFFSVTSKQSCLDKNTYLAVR